MVQLNVNLKQLTILSLVGFLVVACGVAAGLYVTNRYISQNGSFSDPGRELTKEIIIGEPFPMITVSDATGKSMLFSLAQSRNERLVAFLSGDCEPCYSLLSQLKESPLIREHRAELVLLATDPSRFSDSDREHFSTVTMEELQRLDVHLFPTLVRVDRMGKVLAVGGNFTPPKLNEFIGDM